MTKVRVWDIEKTYDIPSLPGYVITKTGIVIRKSYLKVRPCKAGKVEYWTKAREISVNMNAEYAQLEVHKGGRRMTAKLHRLLAETFIPNPDGHPQVNHIDGDKFNNRLDNLEWVSASDNVKHSYKIGLASNKGQRHPRAKLKDSEIPEIIFLRKQGWKLKDIAGLYEVDRSTIGKITNGVNYAQSTGI